jgi:hypothetical protein
LLSIMRLMSSLNVLLFLAVFIPLGIAEFCASTNTGSSFPSGMFSEDEYAKSRVYSLYQSVGACSETCNGFAFAILQGHVSSSLVDVLIIVLLVLKFLPQRGSLIEPLQ